MQQSKALFSTGSCTGTMEMVSGTADGMRAVGIAARSHGPTCTSLASNSTTINRQNRQDLPVWVTAHTSTAGDRPHSCALVSRSHRQSSRDSDCTAVTKVAAVCQKKDGRHKCGRPSEMQASIS